MDEYIVTVHKKQKAVTKEELEKYTKEELIHRIIQIDKHNIQLKNILKKERNTMLADQVRPSDLKDEDPIQRNFDFSKYYKRHILLRFYYLGWDYQGFTVQEHTTKTIEHHIFKSLIRVCLIKDRETSNYHRCGRTDKGVSAFCQVISINIRSNLPPEKQMDPEALKSEVGYCESINRVLPKDIRCVAWMPLDSEEYSARFHCKQRTYRYFFPRGNLDVDAMKEGCKQLIGIHDFRNFCKMDVGNGVVAFIRDIRTAEIHLSNSSSKDSGYDILYLEICAQAFLWHQIRCIMSILILIGQRNEKPNIISSLLDVITNPCTPQYSLASYIPLNLYNCEFKEIPESIDAPDIDLPTKWIYHKESLQMIIGILQGYWTQASVKSAMMQEMLDNLQNIYENELGGTKILEQPFVLMEGVKAKRYQHLLDRIKCKSLENRIEHFTKKKRIDVQIKSDEGDESAGTSCGGGGGDVDKTTLFVIKNNNIDDSMIE